MEQTETPDMMTERCKRIKPTKFDKVVAREICQITDRGTQVFGSQCAIGPNHQANYMLAIVEQDEGTTSKYGICFIDTSIGDFHVGEFDDDKSCSRLLTLLSHHMPVLVRLTDDYLRFLLYSLFSFYLPLSCCMRSPRSVHAHSKSCALYWVAYSRNSCPALAPNSAALRRH